MRTAIIHEWLSTYAGSEKVVEQFLLIYPESQLHALVDFLTDKDRAKLGGRHARTSFIQKLPLAAKKFRNYLPLMPLAIEQFDVSGFDVVISSNHAVAKGVITGPDQLHVSYVHTPIRYAWDLQHQYLAEAEMDRGAKGWLTRAILHYIRLWDQAAANRVDVFVANSNFIARRIWRTYRREAKTIYPPVDVSAFPLREKKDDFYLAASRMVPYKRMALIAEAFSQMPDKKLVMIGDGADLEKVKSVAGPNVQVMGYAAFDVLRDHMQRAKGFIFAAEEDFGITPVEAMACGTPVVAFGRGGATETVIPGKTGVLFDEQSVESLCEGVLALDGEIPNLAPESISNHAQFFRPERFREEFASLVAEELAARRTGVRPARKPPADSSRVLADA